MCPKNFSPENSEHITLSKSSNASADFPIESQTHAQYVSEQDKICKVIIPIYRRPTNEEARAMRHNREVLSKWPHAIIAPEDLDLEGVETICPDTEIIRVSDEWLGRRNGIAGYNKMMLSEEFYHLFDEYRYILICHNDAWIFRDELSEWIAKGYDCVAAP